MVALNNVKNLSAKTPYLYAWRYCTRTLSRFSSCGVFANTVIFIQHFDEPLASLDSRKKLSTMAMQKPPRRI